TVFRRHRRTAELQPTRGDLVYTTEQTWTVSVEDDDPGSTAVQSTSELSLSRPGWEVEVRGSIAISGRESFVLEIELSAHHDGEEIWTRAWDESIPRVWA
ncbi:MAG TPA: hypothetical protein VIW94_03975, partial [Acidimicrobiia bacterium]